MLIKGNQTLVNGKEVLSYPPSLHPHDPSPVQEGLEGFEGEAVVGGKFRQHLPFSQPLRLACPKSWKSSRLQGGRLLQEGW